MHLVIALKLSELPNVPGVTWLTVSGDLGADGLCQLWPNEIVLTYIYLYQRRRKWVPLSHCHVTLSCLTSRRQTSRCTSKHRYEKWVPWVHNMAGGMHGHRDAP